MGVNSMTKTQAKDILDKLKRTNMEDYSKEDWGKRQYDHGYQRGFDEAADLHRQTLEAIDLILHGASEKLYQNYD
jgi:hypothetical protein